MNELRITDTRACCNFLKRSNLQLSVGEFNGLCLDTMTPASRAVTYAILSYSRGRTGHALSFFRLAEKCAIREEELAPVLHLEGILLFAIGDPEGAISRQRECVKACGTTGDKQLTVAALSRLSLISEAIGDKQSAEKYEKRAARLLLRKDFPKGYPSHGGKSEPREKSGGAASDIPGREPPSDSL